MDSFYENFLNDIKSIYAPLIKEYDLEINEIKPGKVLLKSKSFSIEFIVADYLEIEIWFFPNSLSKGYRLDILLSIKRYGDLVKQHTKTQNKSNNDHTFNFKSTLLATFNALSNELKELLDGKQDLLKKYDMQVSDLNKLLEIVWTLHKDDAIRIKFRENNPEWIADIRKRLGQE